MHQPTHMIAMVMHSELPPDDFGDAGPWSTTASGSRAPGVPGEAASTSDGAGSPPTSAGVPARSAPAKRRVPLGVVPAASAGPNSRHRGCGAPLRSATGPCPTGPAPAGDGPRANRHFPSVGAYVFPPEGNCIALFIQNSISPKNYGAGGPRRQGFHTL